MGRGLPLAAPNQAAPDVSAFLGGFSRVRLSFRTRSSWSSGVTAFVLLRLPGLQAGELLKCSKCAKTWVGRGLLPVSVETPRLSPSAEAHREILILSFTGDLLLAVVCGPVLPVSCICLHREDPPVGNWSVLLFSLFSCGPRNQGTDEVSLFALTPRKLRQTCVVLCLLWGLSLLCPTWFLRCDPSSVPVPERRVSVGWVWKDRGFAPSGLAGNTAVLCSLPAVLPVARRGLPGEQCLVPKLQRLSEQLRPWRRVRAPSLPLRSLE